MERLKNKIMYTDIVFNMMGGYFTLGELQQVYEVILGKKLLDPVIYLSNFSSITFNTFLYVLLANNWKLKF